MSRFWTASDPDRSCAVCDSAQAAQLLAWDHHRVLVAGLVGILLTYHWPPLESTPDQLVLQIVFNPAADRHLAPEHIRAIMLAHPIAPDAIQALVDALVFYTC